MRSFAHAWKSISILNDKKNAMPTKVTMNRTIPDVNLGLGLVISVGVRAEVRLCFFVSLIAYICQSRIASPGNAILHTWSQALG